MLFVDRYVGADLFLNEVVNARLQGNKILDSLHALPKGWFHAVAEE